MTRNRPNQREIRLPIKVEGDNPIKDGYAINSEGWKERRSLGTPLWHLPADKVTATGTGNNIEGSVDGN